MELRDYLKENDFTVLEFSKICGVCHSLLYDYMNKHRKPLKKTALKIEAASGGHVSAKELRKIVPVKRVENERT